MNEFKGTPGPWKFFQVGDGIGVRSIHADVAHCMGFDSDRSPSEECANANLIAASPELFKAVNDFLNHFEGNIPLWLFTQAEDAISKALGRVTESIPRVPHTEEQQMEQRDKEAQITLDRRDLFDAVRSAIKEAILDQGSRMEDSELFGEATDRTNKCLTDLYANWGSK